MAPIEAVISGIGGAFPQSEGLHDFIDNLLESRKVSTVDDSRWKPGLLGTSPHVGKISNVHRFDNNLFRVHKPLARLMDPLARLMLERSLEAILDAGLAPRTLENTYTSVFMTTTVSESESRTTSLMHSKKSAGYAIMAGSKTMMSNRISYFLNLNGPSVTLDGDWTVALVAMQRAARSIESGESDFALIGAANTCLFPELNKMYENFGVLSSDGQCRSMDASASGCFRSEGAAVFLLQRADTANRIYARVKGINEICRGTRNRFLGVDTLALSPLMEELYRSTGIDTRQVKLLTSDGISIPEIERDEIEASAAVLCKGGRSGLPVSSAKSVAGHGDAVGALVSVIHAIAAMERGVIPPLQHFSQPHPQCTPLKDGRVKVVTHKQPIALDGDSVLAVNTLGYSGCIAHALLQPNGKVKVTRSDAEFPRLVIVSGRTEEDAVQVANKIVDKSYDAEFIRLTQQAFSEPITGYQCRAATIVPSDQPGLRPIVNSKEADTRKRPIWFVYSGMGSQWAGMGKGLLRLPIFAATIKRLQPILEPEGIDLTHTLTTDNSELFENIIYSFISIAAIQIGLTNVARSLGIEPDGIIGHSTGELGCAYGDGCLSEEETLRAAYARGKASLAVKLIRGMMASIGLGWKEAEGAVPDSLDVACHNSVDNCTISGPTDDVLKYVDELKEKNIFARTVNVSNIAFHSRYVQPAGPILQSILETVIKFPKKRSSRWVPSSIAPGDEDKETLKYAGPEFFTNNLLSPVRFEKAMEEVPPNAVVIELAPHGLMQPLIRRGLPEGAATIALTRRGHSDGLRFLLENVGKLFMEGVPVKPWVLAPEVPMPVSRGTPTLGDLATWDHREEWPLVINTRSQTSRPRTVLLYPETTPCITQGGKRSASPSFFLEIVWKELADNKSFMECPVVFENLEIVNQVEMITEENLEVVLQIQRETGVFEMGIVSEETEYSLCLMRGMIYVPEDSVTVMKAQPKDREGIRLERVDVYSELQDRDLKYDDSLKTLKHVTFGETDTSGECDWSGSWYKLFDSLFQLPSLTQPRASAFCSKIRKFVIQPQKLASAGNAVQVCHCLATGQLAAPGVLIEGYSPMEIPANTSDSALEIAVQPLEHHANIVPDDFIDQVAMIRIQNSDTQDPMFSILVLEAELNYIASKLQQAIRKAVGRQVVVRKLLLKNTDKIPTDVKGSAIIVTDFSTMQVDRVLSHFSTPMILRWGSRCGHTRYVALASNLSAAGSLTLLVQPEPVLHSTAHVLHIKGDDAVPENVATEKEVILVWRGLPREGIFGAVGSARGKPYGMRARLVIILDEDAPEFSLQESIYSDRLSLGLLVNIFQDKRWNELHISAFQHLPTVPIRVEGYKTHILGLNPSDLSEDHEPHLGVYDYCGLRDGLRYMGLARFGSGAVAVPDDILRWPVPNGWTEQQAATVPMAYAVAFHVLEVLAHVQPGEVVLVMNGTLPVSQACIRVALQRGCEVITTASSEKQRKQVVALNPQVHPERVFRSDKNTLKYYLRKATASKGWDVGIIPTCGRVLQDVFQSCAMNGRSFVLSKKDALKHRVGMWPFVNSAEMFSAGPEKLLTASPRDKLLVQKAVQDGLNSCLVQPIHSRVSDKMEDVDLTTLHSPVKQLLRVHETGNKKPRLGIAFAVAGGRASSLLTVARAASAQGCSVVLAAPREGGIPLRAKLVPALGHTGLVPFPKAQEDAKLFLQAASQSENLKAIVLNIEDAVDCTITSVLKGALPTVNGALRGVRLLVITHSLSLGTETVEAWRRMGLPACAVVGEPRQAALLLPSLLTSATLPAAVLAYPSGTDCRVALGAPAFRPRPTEAGDVHRSGGHTLVEVPTLAPRLRWRHNRQEPIPLITVKGPVLSTARVEEAAGALLSPILVGDGSQLTAEKLAQEILRVQPRGPWALYGDVENSELLLRASSLVEKKAGRPNWQEVVHLALLENLAKPTEPVAEHAGSLHLIRQYEGTITKTASLNKRKMRHLVSDSRHIAAVLNEHLLSPLSKIVSC